MKFNKGNTRIINKFNHLLDIVAEYHDVKVHKTESSRCPYNLIIWYTIRPETIDDLRPFIKICSACMWDREDVTPETFEEINRIVSKIKKGRLIK